MLKRTEVHWTSLLLMIINAMNIWSPKIDSQVVIGRLSERKRVDIFPLIDFLGNILKNRRLRGKISLGSQRIAFISVLNVAMNSFMISSK